MVPEHGIPGSNRHDAVQEFAGDSADVGRGCYPRGTNGADHRTIYEALCEKKAIKGLKDREKCAMYLAKLLAGCIPEVAVAAGRIMGWLREVTSIIAKANRGMTWVTPAGVLVIQENRVPKEIRLRQVLESEYFFT